MPTVQRRLLLWLLGLVAALASPAAAVPSLEPGLVSVPEPATWLMMLIGLLGLGYLGRPRRPS